MTRTEHNQDITASARTTIATPPTNTKSEIVKIFGIPCEYKITGDETRYYHEGNKDNEDALVAICENKNFKGTDRNLSDDLQKNLTVFDYKGNKRRTYYTTFDKNGIPQEGSVTCYNKDGSIKREYNKIEIKEKTPSFFSRLFRRQDDKKRYSVVGYDEENNYSRTLIKYEIRNGETEPFFISEKHDRKYAVEGLIFNKDNYHGMAHDAKKHGFGISTSRTTEHYGDGDRESVEVTIQYTGQFENNAKHGPGTIKKTYEDNSQEYSFTGNFKDGSKDGQGTETIIYKNGNSKSFTGNFKDGSKHGQGTETTTYKNGNSKSWTANYYNDNCTEDSISYSVTVNGKTTQIRTTFNLFDLTNPTELLNRHKKQQEQNDATTEERPRPKSDLLQVRDASPARSDNGRSSTA